MPTIEVCKRDLSVMQKFEDVSLDMTVLEFKKLFLSQNEWASKFASCLIIIMIWDRKKGFRYGENSLYNR